MATNETQVPGANDADTKPEVPAGINVFECKDKGTEYPIRFGGHEVRYNILVAGATPEETVQTFVRDFVAPNLTPEQQAEVVADYLNGYGLTYTRNGVVKRVLNADDTAKLEIADALDLATRKANEHRVGAVAKREGGKGGKVKKLEAERDAVKASARTMYLAMPKNLRKQLRPNLISEGTFTEAELDEMDQA